MGLPAEARERVAHLLNVRNPYSYTEPDWALLCQGITELTETFEADTEDVQYICETTKTTDTKGYTVGFDLEMGYIKENKVQMYMNRILRLPPTGANTSGDYIRFNKDEVLYGYSNRYIGVRRHATVQAVSIGGAATDSLTSAISVRGSSDPEVGFVTVNNADQNNIIYTWTPATTAVPVITAPLQNETITSTNVTIQGVGIVGASVKVYYGTNQSLDPVTVGTNGKWATTVEASTLGNNPKIAAIQTSTDGMDSVSSDPVTFNVISSLEAPIITVPTSGATNVAIKPTFSGTGVSGATVTVTANDEEVLTTVVGGNGLWSGVINTDFEAETEYTATAIQTLNTLTSPASTAVTFTTISA